MTQSNENGSRLDRIETIMLELATASVRHDNAISRHDEEFSRINAQQEANIHAIANLTAEQQLGRQDINSLTASIQELRNHQEATTAGQEFNRQSIATLTASIQELRNLLADYLQGRNQ